MFSEYRTASFITSTLRPREFLSRLNDGNLLQVVFHDLLDPWNDIIAGLSVGAVVSHSLERPSFSIPLDAPYDAAS